MPNFINNTERENHNHGFHITEVTKQDGESYTTTTIYEGRCISSSRQLETDTTWEIKQTVVTEYTDGTVISTEKWATETAAWTDRATLTYKYR